MTEDLNFENLSQSLRQKKDEIHLKIHLASMEIAEEWEKAQKQFDTLELQLGQLSTEAKGAGQELLSSAEKLAVEVDHAFDRIRNHLK